MTGHHIVRAAWMSTAVFAVVTALGVASSDLEVVTVVGDLVLFFVGAGVFAAAYLIGIGRSRTDELGIGGWFLLLGSTAPRPVKLHLIGNLLLQCGIALGTAWVRYPKSGLAFGTLVPLLGLGWCGLWGARHGRFRPRAARPGRPAPKPTEPRSRPSMEQNAEHG